MATLLELCNKNQLFLYEPVLGPSKVEDRFIYFLPKAKEWLEKTLPTEASNWNLDESPLEQVDSLLATFCSGESLAIERVFNPLVYRKIQGIWELKTADVRIFGWFPKKDNFIAARCDSANRVKEFGLYQGYSSETRDERDSLDLTPPKFITGGNPDDVISTWHNP